MSNILKDRKLFLNDAITLANNLLGKILVRNFNGILTKSRIVETEAYMGADDQASHSYRMRRTQRTLPMYEIGGTTYVYFTYGMHYCLNIVANKSEIPQAVLIRAVELISGYENLLHDSHIFGYNRKLEKLTNGPAKLCKFLNINKQLNNLDLLNNEELWLESDNFETKPADIVCCKRIGIESAVMAKDKLWRFYLRDNKFVSKISKIFNN